MNWYVAVLKKYAVFDGRASRPEYWYFTLINVVIEIVLGFVDGMIGTYNAHMRMGLLGGLYQLAVFLPALGVTIRRLHDTGRSGWWVLISVIPIIGWLVLIFFLIQPGTPGPNEYGPEPNTVAE